MKKILLKLASFLVIMILMIGCKKDYITGGKIENVDQYAHLTTYDYLKGDPLYDTLTQLIDAAGLKDKINGQATTFFAPTDYSIFKYLNERTIAAQQLDVNAKFGLDSLLYYISKNVDGTKDSLLMYLIPQSLPYAALTNTGKLYSSELAGDSVIISYEYTKDGNLGYNPVVSASPQIVYFTQLWHSYDLSDGNPAGDITPDIGIHTLVKTSGIITQTGIVNVLESSHTLFFYGTKQ